MNGMILDGIAVAVVVVFLILGIHNGFIKSVVKMVGCLASVVAAYLLYDPVSTVLFEMFDGKDTLVWKTATYLGIFLVAMIVIALLGDMIDKVFSFLPVIKQLNSLLGGVMGAIEGVLIVLVLYAALQFYLAMAENEAIITAQHLQESTVVSWLTALAF